ncbi:TIGR03668 family PPOX class F420-dependent oxidoreductase [Halosolutus amylolyticus]|uniref:TIGR03668 family PPOX class F420-dependent oxidoreductase n=1 Tax=Halosolutus amylolyticus TaxID=2932267 RepID=A0ABD5PP53_9EURY|nr:TIGR03668 family PPOX class F420-dependent oxidoreductase [Halosolutus amylolyticus]
MTPAERAFLERARVAALATVDADGRPHVVPICYALLDADDARLVTAIDEKPKSTRDLQRVRNVRTEPRVTVLADRYREDWSRLAWVQVRGKARVLSPGADSHAAAVTALEAKYEQYADHDLADRPIIAIVVAETRSWGALEE